MSGLRDDASSPPVWDAQREEGLRAAARALAQGGVVMAPTESSYCLAALPNEPGALAIVRAIKSRDAERGKPLLVLCGSLEQVEALALLGELARRLARAWPLALTLVVEPRDVALARALGADTLALRVPAHAAARALAQLAGAYTGTSANAAGEPPIVSIAEAAGVPPGPGIAGILDAGPLPGGPPSTLVDARGAMPIVLREGAVPTSRVLALASQ